MHRSATSAPALPSPWCLRAPGCPASRTPAIHHPPLPSLVTRISNIGLTWSHSITCYYLPYICQFPNSVPAAALIVFCLCFLVCCASTHDRMQQPSHDASGSTGVPVGMVASALSRHRGYLASLSGFHAPIGLPRLAWMAPIPCQASARTSVLVRPAGPGLF